MRSAVLGAALVAAAFAHAASIPRGSAMDTASAPAGTRIRATATERRSIKRSKKPLRKRACSTVPPVSSAPPEVPSSSIESTPPSTTASEPVTETTAIPPPAETSDVPPETTDAPPTTTDAPPGSTDALPETTETPTPSPTEAPAPQGPTKTQDGPTPSVTKGTDDDPYLLSLSLPLNYGMVPAFTAPKTGGVVTYYAQSQGACGDTYDDSTYTAAIAASVYDQWPGANSASTNRNPVCGPYVEGRFFLTPAEEVVPGPPLRHATIGGDGLINCQLGEQCHVPLTATVFNPATNASITVAIVDRCVGCADVDIDLAPSAFLKLTRPDLDTSGFALGDYMVEASKDQQGRVPMQWSFDQTQLFKGIVGEMGGTGCVGGCNPA